MWKGNMSLKKITLRLSELREIKKFVYLFDDLSLCLIVTFNGDK